MDNQSLHNTAQLSLPTAGAILLGRVTGNMGHIARVEGYLPDGKIKVLHHDTRLIRNIKPATLLACYRFANESDPPVDWSDPLPDAKREAATGAALPSEDAAGRTKAKRTKRTRTGITADSSDVVEVSDPQPPAVATVVEPEPQSAPAPAEDPKIVLAKVRAMGGDLRINNGRLEWRDLDETTKIVVTRNKDALIDLLLSGGGLHFGPSPMSKSTEMMLVLGHDLPVYTSCADRSAWLAGSDVAKEFNISLPWLYKKFSHAGPRQASKFPFLSSSGHVEYRWLAQADLVKKIVEDRIANAVPVDPVAVADAPPPPPLMLPPAAIVETAQGGEDEFGVLIPDGMVLANFHGVVLAIPPGSEGDALLYDLDLGRRLGLTRPRDIRKTIQEMVGEGILPGLLPRARQARGKNQHGEAGTVETSGYWLREKEVVKVIMRSRSAVAYALIDEIADGFLAWQRGRTASLPAGHTDVAKAVATEVNAVLPMIARTVAEAVMSSVYQAKQANDQDAKAADEMRSRAAGAKKRAEETRRLNTDYPAVSRTFLPLVGRFLRDNFTSADMRDPTQKSRCVTAGKAREMFATWLRRANTHIPPHPRLISRMLNECSNGVRGGAEDDDHVLLPWIEKAGASADPRQTNIPGVDQ